MKTGIFVWFFHGCIPALRTVPGTQNTRAFVREQNFLLRDPLSDEKPARLVDREGTPSPAVQRVGPAPLSGAPTKGAGSARRRRRRRRRQPMREPADEVMEFLGVSLEEMKIPRKKTSYPPQRLD